MFVYTNFRKKSIFNYIITCSFQKTKPFINVIILGRSLKNILILALRIYNISNLVYKLIPFIINKYCENYFMNMFSLVHILMKVLLTCFVFFIGFVLFYFKLFPYC